MGSFCDTSQKTGSPLNAFAQSLFILFLVFFLLLFFLHALLLLGFVVFSAFSVLFLFFACCVCLFLCCLWGLHLQVCWDASGNKVSCMAIDGSPCKMASMTIAVTINTCLGINKVQREEAIGSAGTSSGTTVAGIFLSSSSSSLRRGVSLDAKEAANVKVLPTVAAPVPSAGVGVDGGNDFLFAD